MPNMNLENNVIALKKLRDDYFNQLISISDYRHTRKQLLDTMEGMLNGTLAVKPDLQRLITAPIKEDIDPFIE